MHIQTAVLCDYAVNYGNNFCLIGCFDSIVTSRLPVAKPHFTIALHLIITPDDFHAKRACLSIIDADGNPLDPEKMPFCIDVDTSVPQDMDFITRHYILNCNGMEFGEEGEYSVDFTINGQLAIRIPFRVELSPEVKEKEYLIYQQKK